MRDMDVARLILSRILVACVLSVALVAAGCGGDDDSSSQADASPAEEWADGFCSALTMWTNDLEAAAEPFTDLSSFSEESIRQAADDAKNATETLTESMRSLGAPDTSSGDQVETAVDDLATELESGAQEIEDAVADVSSVADVPAAVGTVTATLSQLGREVGSALQTIGDADASGELETAFEDADSCDDLLDSTD
jgi:methyl-accepting chemotaxis protein